MYTYIHLSICHVKWFRIDLMRSCIPTYASICRFDKSMHEETATHDDTPCLPTLRGTHLAVHVERMAMMNNARIARVHDTRHHFPLLISTISFPLKKQ